VPCQEALLLTLEDGLSQSNFGEAMSALNPDEKGSGYGHERLCRSLVLLTASGVLRLSHINDQAVASWGALLDKSRRPDGDTLDQFLNEIIRADEVGSESTVSERLGQIRPNGQIDMAQRAALCNWVEAGLTEGDVWYFDDHVSEYSGKARIGKTKHGTKHFSVKSVNRYTLHNGLCTLSEYFPVTVSYAEAMRHLVQKANACLPPEFRIRQLSFDRAGWDAPLLQWLQQDAEIIPITWVKRTQSNIKLLDAVADNLFCTVDTSIPIGKSHKQQVVSVADTTLEFPHLGLQRVIVLETNTHKRIGIYTTALQPANTSLSDPQAMSACTLMDTMRYKQRIENRFKVEVHEMGSDALPSQLTHQATLLDPYDLLGAQQQLDKAQRRVDKHTVQQQQQQQLHESGQLNKHQFNLLDKRSQRLKNKAQRETDTLSQEIDRLHHDQDGNPVLSTSTEVLDVRKLTLLNLFKLHALVALKILARRLGLPDAGPERLRRAFLAFGDRVEFDHEQQVATVYARPFPRAQTRRAYEHLCAELQHVPMTLNRNGIPFRLKFSCNPVASEHGNNALHSGNP